MAHSYLFCGPAGCGKHTTALALAAALNCTTAPGQGCGTCVSCEKIATGIHPDVQTLERQGTTQIIPIETIRTQVIPKLGMQPHEGAARVFLIEEAASLPSASANALLKTLEEPPLHTHFILGTTAPEQLLPTIRSRCQRVSFGALAADLRAELEGDTETAERLAALGAELRRAAQEDDVERLHRAAAEVAGDRTTLIAVLELLSQQLHGEARNAALADRLDEAARLGRQAAIMLRTHDAVAHMAHGQLAVEAMLHDLRAAAVL